MVEILALSGGIGGAKLALGLDRTLPPGALAVVCNTGDDFQHLGFAISPDIDTVIYTLAGIANKETGWGRANETWTFMAALADLGGESWFQLGDADLTLHVERTRRLASGETLSAITDVIRRRLEIGSEVIPMSDQPVRTRVQTSEGILPFQHYFVKRRCRPAVRGFEFDGVDMAQPAPRFAELLTGDRLKAVIICPSNPFISIDPILALPGLRQALRNNGAPVVAISPVINGKAVKGPTAKMMVELGLPVTTASIARHYGELIDVLVVDHSDDTELPATGAQILRTTTLMHSDADKLALAAEILACVETLQN
jgi:LPPG:FO 2-phospho-L-lactate transferase|tara:strand:- start:945 stop:1883 length:939 start_codon:yes stop_codon:yes gene_type:complete